MKQQTLAEAFTPFPVREGRTTYGLGWNIVTDGDGKRVGMIHWRVERRVFMVKPFEIGHRDSGSAQAYRTPSTGVRTN